MFMEENEPVIPGGLIECVELCPVVLALVQDPARVFELETLAILTQQRGSLICGTLGAPAGAAPEQ